MALVFSLRILNLGLWFLLLSGVLFLIGITDSRQWESLAVLFSIFLLMVGVALLWIRLSRRVDKFFLSAPLVLFLLPESPVQLPFLILAFLLFLQGLAGGGRRFQCSSLFHLAQLVWLLLWASVSTLSQAYKPGVLALLSALLWAFLTAGFWRWQWSVKRVMESLDLDRES